MNSPRTIEKYLEKKRNHFDMVRLIAAILVIFSHGYALTGNSNQEPLASFSGIFSFGHIAVASFFIISGFLITASYLKRNDIFFYLSSRLLRIFPGLIVVTLITALIIGSIVTRLSWHDYFSHSSFFLYILHNTTLISIHYQLPGVFENNVYPNAVNGSLWTLPIEFCLYLFIAVIGAIKVLKKPFLTTIIISILLIGPLITTSIFPSLVKNQTWNSMLMALSCFGIGALFYLWRTYIILNFWLGLSLIIITYSLIHAPLFKLFFFLTLAYWIFLFAFEQRIDTNKFTHYGDFSYGLYIYGFLVQQTLVHYLHINSSLQLFSLALPITSLLAIVSWYYIEKPALHHKEKLALILQQIYIQIFKRKSKEISSFS